MKFSFLSSLLGLFLFAGCATKTYVVSKPKPEPIVYYGWAGTYYGPYYWGPAGTIIYGLPPNWHGGFYRPTPTNAKPDANVTPQGQR